MKHNPNGMYFLVFKKMFLCFDDKSRGVTWGSTESMIKGDYDQMD